MDDQTLEYYQKRAPEYDKIYFRDNPDRQAELANMYTVSRQVLAGRHVLDLACGTGFWTKIVSERAKTIIGIDINPATLAEARRKHFSCPTHLVLGDFFHLPIAAGKADSLLATYVISHVRREDLPRLRDEICRIIEPGSPAFMCDNNPLCETQPEMIWDEENVNSYKRRRLENGEEYLILKNYFERRELDDIFASWGAVERLTYDAYYWSATIRMKG